MAYLYETHVHTAEGSKCGTSTAAEQVRAYKQLGYAGIIVTDHFINGNATCPLGLPWEESMQIVLSGYFAAKDEGDKIGLDVFLGWEFGGRGAEQGLELLTYGLGMDFLLAHPKLNELPHKQYCNLVHKHGGFIAQAHPYREKNYITNPGPICHTLLDAVEVYNVFDPAESNQKALQFARKHNLPQQAGSDSHNKMDAVRTGVELVKKADTIFDIIHAIKAGEVKLIK